MIVWVHEALVVPSVAVHVRAIVRVPPQLSVTASRKLVVIGPHPPDGVGLPVEAGDVSPGHAMLRLEGQVSTRDVSKLV